MPRGDKVAIMGYEIEKHTRKQQDAIASILQPIDDKISLNREINNNLLEQASVLFQEICVDDTSSDWVEGVLGDIADITSGKRPPMRSDYMTEEAKIPLVGAASIMGYTSEANHTDKILVTGRVGTHGVVQRFNYPCWTSDNTTESMKNMSVSMRWVTSSSPIM